MPFTAGQSGNPNGGRKAKEARDALRLALTDGVSEKPRNKLDAIVRAHIEKAMEGDMPAIKEIYDRIDGKVPQGLQNAEDEDGVTTELLIRVLKAG